MHWEIATEDGSVHLVFAFTEEEAVSLLLDLGFLEHGKPFFVKRV